MEGNIKYKKCPTCKYKDKQSIEQPCYDCIKFSHGNHSLWEEEAKE